MHELARFWRSATQTMQMRLELRPCKYNAAISCQKEEMGNPREYGPRKAVRLFQ